jgi:hypothetical protein
MYVTATSECLEGIWSVLLHRYLSQQKKKGKRCSLLGFAKSNEKSDSYNKIILNVKLLPCHSLGGSGLIHFL